MTRLTDRVYFFLVALKSNSLMQVPRQWSFDLRSLLAREPKLWWFYQPYIWWDQKNITSRGIAQARERIVGSHTELVIDGFPGSANSFATAAFRHSQTRPVELAHHMHSPVQIMQAIHLETPVIVTVRDPRGATLSLTSRWPYLSVAQGLRNYTHFYRKLLPYSDKMVISAFERTIKEFDDVIQETNQRFHTNFAPFDNTEENRMAVRRPEKFHTEAWRQRQENKKLKARAFESAKCKRLLAKAEAVYEEFLQRSRSRQLQAAKR